MKSEKRESVCRIVKLLGITLAVYACVGWMLPLVIPFFVAFLLAKLLNPLVEKLNKKIKIKRAVASAILVGILVLATGVVLVIFLQTFMEQVRHVISNLGIYRKQVGVIWDNCCGQMEVVTGIMAEELQKNV